MANIRLIVFYAITLGAIIIPMLVASKRSGILILLEQLRQTNPAYEALSETLRSISGRYTVIGKELTVKKMLDSMEYGLPREYCRLRELFKELEYIQHSDLNFVLNVYNFMNQNNEDSKSFCARGIELVFRDKKRLIELDKGKLEAEETKKILDDIEGKEFLLIGALSVEIIMDQESKTTFDEEDCYYNKISRRNSYLPRRLDGFVRNLYKNIRNFDKTSFKRLISFCAENIEKVYNRCYRETYQFSFKDFQEKINSFEPHKNYFMKNILNLCHGLRFKLIGNVEHIEKSSGIKMPDSFRVELDKKKSEIKSLCEKYDGVSDSEIEFELSKVYLDDENIIEMSDGISG